MLPGQRNGEVRLNGALTHWTGISSAMASGVGFVPEDRKKEGLFLTHTVGFNLTLSILKKMTNKMGAILKERENEKIHELFRALSIKCESSHVSARRLSGGNQQKVLLAKVLASHPSILFLDEPTRGIDVGAKEEIYELIRGLAKEGLAILLVSSELNEILALSDRVVVLRGGEMVADLENENLEQEKILAYAAGV